MAAEANPTRIGFLIDGDPDTDLMTAVYEFDKVSVRLRVPFRAHEDKRERWWGLSIQYMDDLDRKKYAYSPPDELIYYDSQGPVGLIGCRSGGATTSLTTPAGIGTIRARYAVEGASDAAHYLKINGLRSEIDGLSHWLGAAAHSTQMKFPRDGQPLEITTTMTPVDDIPLARGLNLKAIVLGSGPAAWAPEVTYRSRVFIETHTGAKRQWSDHLELHLAMRDLLRVAAWKPIAFQSHGAASSDEKQTRGDDAEVQPWHEVRTVTTGIAEPVWRQNDRFLFYYSDIKKSGVGKWLKLAKSYERGIMPLVRLLDLEGATVDAVISQLGIAVEAIGYQALIDSGKTPAQANNTKVKNRIDHLLSVVAGALSFADPNFAQDLADSYNSVKHANRAPVDPAIKTRHFRQGVELLRVWVALRLGVKPKTLAARR